MPKKFFWIILSFVKMNSKECEILNLILNSPTTKLEFCVAQLTLVHLNIENGDSFFSFSFCFTFLFQKRKEKREKLSLFLLAHVRSRICLVKRSGKELCGRLSLFQVFMYWGTARYVNPFLRFFLPAPFLLSKPSYACPSMPLPTIWTSGTGYSLLYYRLK